MPEKEVMKQEKHRIQCPYCEYWMPVYFYDQKVIPERTGLYMRCKRQECRKEFELRRQ